MYRKPRKPGFIGAFPWALVLTLANTIILGNWCATQYAALHYRGLGMPLFTVFRRAVYPPFRWASWLIQSRGMMSNQSRTPLFYALLMGIGSLFLGVIFARIVAAVRLRRLSTGGDDLHGSSRFATTKDIDRAGLLSMTEGLFVGGWHDGDMLKYLRHTGPESVIAIAPPRSGKGVSLVIPVLLDHQANVVVHDTKGELWQLTSGYRSRELGHKCVKFSPVEEDSDGYNPFAEIRIGSMHEAADAQNIINILVRSTESTAHVKHWHDTAESLGIGMTLHQLYLARNEGRVASPTDVYQGLAPAGMTFREYLEYCLNYDHDVDGSCGWIGPDGQPTRTHPAVRQHFQMQLNRSDDEFASVVSTLSTAFLVFTDPLVARATAFSSFRLTDLLCAAPPISLYVTIPPSDKKRLQPLLRLLFTQVIQRNTETLDHQRPSVGPKDRLLLMIDEAGSLGRMDIFAEALAYMPGYHMQAYLIFHNMGQIHEHYGQNNAMLGSTHVKIAFAPNTKETAEFLSDMTGKTTLMRANYSFSGKRGAFYGAQQISGHVDYVARPLLTADEVMRLKGIGKTPERLIPGDMLIFLAGQYPIFGTQMLYLADPEFVRRSLIPPPRNEMPVTSKPKETLEAIAGGVA
jgi:type IV secretion system protein VirD4